MNKNSCNNCGKQGHSFHQCKLPVTSYGIILFIYFIPFHVYYENQNVFTLFLMSYSSNICCSKKINSCIRR